MGRILILVGFLYVVLMMALAEAMSPHGTVLGAVFTFLLYGVLPLGVLGYILTTPERRRRRRRLEAQSAAQPDGSGEPAGDAVAPVRKEP